MENYTGEYMESRQIVYRVLLTQIQFGVYRYRDTLPTLMDASKWFLVAIDTVRPAYGRLKEEGYISLSTNVGARVQVRYREEEVERFIQTYFASRKSALLDLSKCIQPLFGNAQWVGLKNASPETLCCIENIARCGLLPPYTALRHLSYKYASLGNDLLMRIAWQMFMFYQAPFFSLTENLQYFDALTDYVPGVVRFCREKNWEALQIHIDAFQSQITSALEQFYRTGVTMPSPEQEIGFCWNTYKKPSQLCYSLAWELLVEICRGMYPVGSRLPTQKELMEMKNVSSITLRRALDVLRCIGVVRLERGARPQILSPTECAENCNFTKPSVRGRLMDFVQSLQLLALSCKAVSMLTLQTMGAEAVDQWNREWHMLKDRGAYVSLVYVTLDLVARFSPYQAIQSVYSELLKQLWWGYPLRGLHGNTETVNALYAPYYEFMTECLQHSDAARFSAKLEELLLYEVRFAAEHLVQMGVEEAGRILIPEKS
ncbi:GntR family transcriptional regulator [Clostridium sp. D33t1_170424_F3]|uniref:GntR family transcriptional regulator n=1 Tax=Clostridium sp. D33t1_170424_F3 TaxID=2787099 RepID=UPI0018AB2837|nr:GntR family transcriptional regulator [Clostridium sp. D33t1_170424_F3]